MFLNDLVQRRLASLLHPWLQQEPELQFKLGFLRSHGFANNLSFDTSVLNQLLDEPTRLSFKEVRVDQLSLRISYWSVPAFTIAVHGVHVTLSVGQVKEEKRRNSTDTSLVDMRKVLTEIDPEGSALHDVMGRISDTGSSGNWTTPLLNVILNCCQLQMSDIHLQVEFPISNDSFGCLWEIKELNAESQYTKHGCFFRGLISSLFVPLKECSFNINVRGFGIGLQSKDSISRVLPSVDLFTCIKLKDLQLIDFTFSIPELTFLFTPADLSIILAFGTLSSSESKCARNGRQLWKIAASRISSLISTPRLVLHKLVDDVGLWLRYVHAYENLLLQFGYPVDNSLKISAAMMSWDIKVSRSVKNQWKLISEIEKKLPAEAIAQARRIARYRAGLNAQRAKDHSNESQKILPLLALAWNIICIIFSSITHFFSQIFLADNPKIDGHCRVVSEDSFSQHCFSLSVDKISIIASPVNAVQPPVWGKVVSEIGISYSELLSFCLSIDALFLTYTENICEQYFSISCGHLKVMSSSIIEDGSKNNNNNNTSYLKRHWDKNFDDAKTIVWGEPAQMFYPVDTRNGFPYDLERTSVSFLENLLGETWLNWKNSCTNFEGIKIQNLENPWILCEIKSFLTDQGLQNLNSGFWKCSLIVGKLNFVLGYSSLLLIALLLGQIQHALYMGYSNGRKKVLSLAPVTLDRGMEMTMARMLPEKHIQIGVFIAGPHIQISLRKEGFYGGNSNVNPIVRQDDLHLAFDVHNIEFAVWPILKSAFASSSGYRGLDDVHQLECLRLMEPQIIDIPISENEIYTCRGRISLCTYFKVNGLNAYFGDLENQHCQIIVLNPTTIQLSSLREDLHSFSTAVVSFSAALHGMATGLTCLLYMDELFVLFKVVVGLFSAVSCGFTSCDSFGGASFQEFRRQDMACAESVREGTSVMRKKGVYLNCLSTLFVINGTFELKSVDMILHHSRKSSSMKTSKILLDPVNGIKLAMHGVPEHGIWISVQQTSLEFSCKGGNVEVLFDVSGIRCVIFRDQSEIQKSPDQYELGNLLLHSLDCLYEVLLSHCTFSLWLGSLQSALPSGNANNAVDGSTSGGKISYTVEDFPSAIDTERSRVQSLHFFQKPGFAPNIMAPASSHWLLINIAISEIYMVGCAVKNIVDGAQKSNKLQSSLSVGGEFQTIFCQIQGGTIFLETTALAMLVQCFASYCRYIRSLLHVEPSSEECIRDETGEDMAIQDGHPSQRTENTFQQVKWEQLEAFTIDLSQISLVLVATDESGGLRELLFEADVHMNYKLDNMNRKLSFDLSRLSILSQFLHETMEQQTCDIQIPHFASVKYSDLSPHSERGDPRVSLQHTDEIHPVLDDASCSSPPPPENVSLGNNSLSPILHVGRQNYILKQLGASISVQKPVPGDEIGPLCLNQIWVGSGSISGFDMTISLSEIQILLSTVESFSEVFGKETSDNMEQKHWSSDLESDRSLEKTVPDGAIVAIQDVHQHLYMTVEGVESKYSLVGAIHYSLVGERALFRVKYQNQRRWNSKVLWFSLISLHAKSDSGEPLRLNYRPGSGFVDISSTNDSGWALWRILSSKPESYEGGDIELESNNLLAKNTFYLVNKKNDRAVAIVDGVPEFVSKPGNPFKWKVFLDLPVARNVLLLDSYSVEPSRTNLQHNAHVNKERTLGQTGNLPHIVITVDKVTLTILHELSDTKEKFPLLKGSISTTEFIIQILVAKARVISTLRVVLYYFDAKRNLWREFVHPLEICVFYRTRLKIQGSETVLHGVPVHFYARIKELGISITELSLDILLFVIGTLNLAGPFAIRNSMILANSCKVENQSGLDLLCHFYDNQDASIARKQSSIIVLRHLGLVNQPPEASCVSIQLAERGAFLTSPIHLSLLKAGSLAWRTRIVSLQDSKAYPGPYIIVDISRETEDGLSIVVSPLLRIHNETEFSVEVRFQRPQQKDAESASVVLKTGDTIDDSIAAFDAITLSGGLKKALMSLNVGNFLFSFRPEITEELRNSKKLLSVEWSDDLKGGKAIPLSGVFDKLSYKVRKAISVEPVRYSFGTTHCSLKYEDGHVVNLHFLIQSIRRDVPVIKPDKYGYVHGNRNSPIALQEQKEIFLLPTVRVSNLLQSEIHVLLTDMDPCADNIGNQATIPCGSTVDLYANPDTIYFCVTLTAFNTSCKPVNSGDWVKKLQKQKNDVHRLDIELDFGGGKYFASLRLSRGYNGILEAVIFTSYTLKNETDFPLLCFAPNQKLLSRDEAEKLGYRIPPELGSFLPPKSTRSWFMKFKKVRLKLLEDKASEVMLDLDALSGLTEVGLEVEESSGFKHIAKLGVSLGPYMSKVNVPSQIISVVPRYILFNESEEVVIVQQCHLEDGMEQMITINSKQKIALQLQSGISKKREMSVFENLLRKHRNARDDSLAFIQFRPNEAGLGWSGPVCIASLGRFFLKFKRSMDFTVQQSNQVTADTNHLPEFAAVHVVEEGSTLVLHYYRPPNINLPYRIENCLQEAFILYYQKGLEEPEILRSGSSVNYVWDDLTLPHKLVVQIKDVHLLREINLDKVRAWKPFYRVGQHRGLGFHLPLDKKPGASFGESNDMEMVNVGYEVYADGPTRVLRICEFSGSHNGDTKFQSSGKIRVRILHFAIHLLEHAEQGIDASESAVYTPIVVTRLENINLDSIFTDRQKYNQIGVQSLSVDQKWVGAPFAAMLRRHQSDFSDTSDNILHVALILFSSSSNVKQVKYFSVVLQPLDLNLDEETLMRIVPFWRTSLSDSNTQSQQYYFDHFEIHPIKIIASFLPGDSYSSYSSTQETLRSLLHSVIKIPAIKNMIVELNGVLVTHALITIRELFIKCAQHYSWYAMRAIYIAKGSPLLPPAFASIFDDSASSSLDVFFDPSSGLINLPGLTIGTFKLIRKCIDDKGFSGTKRYFGDLGKTVKTAGSNIIFAAVTEISDSVLKCAETSGFNGMVNGFHQGILKLAMEPSVLGTVFMEGGPDRKIKLDRSPGVDELYIEGYLQAMLDTIYKQEYLRVRVIDNQVFLKNLPPNSSLIDEIVDRVKGFLVSKALLKGDSLTTSSPLRHLRGESEWKIGPTVLTLCEHLFVSFAIRMLRKQAGKFMARVKWSKKLEGEDQKAIIAASTTQEQKGKLVWKWGIGKFMLSGIIAYMDGRLCRRIPNPVARRIVSGFLLSFIDKNDDE